MRYFKKFKLFCIYWIVIPKVCKSVRQSMWLPKKIVAAAKMLQPLVCLFFGFIATCRLQVLF